MNRATGDAVLAANEAFYEAFNSRDMGAMEDLWAAETEVSCIHPGWNVLRGREPVIDSWQRILTNPAQPKLLIGGAEVTLAGDAAVVVCRELVAGSPLAATNVFVRERGAWRLLHHQSGPVSV